MNANDKLWWTYCGNVGKDCSLLAHQTSEGAQWHYGMSRSLGGAYRNIGITRRPATEAEIRAALSDRFVDIQVVNPTRATA